MSLFEGRFKSGALKFDGVPARFGASAHQVYPMWVADTDFPPPENVTRGLGEFVAHHYGYQQLEMTSVISQWHWRRNEYIDESQLVDCVSVIAAMTACVETLTSPGAKVGVFTPVYGPFYGVIEKSGRQLCKLPLVRSETRYGIDLSTINDDLAMVLMCSPHNPTGTLWKKAEIEAVAARCKTLGIPLVIDEVHRGFVEEGAEFVSGVSIDETIADAVIVLQSPSKSYNIAHLPGAAYAIIKQSAWRDRVRSAIMKPHLFASALARRALILAYDEINDLWLEKISGVVDVNRRLLIDALSDTSFLACSPQSTYFMWLDAQQYYPQADGQCAKALFMDTGIAANDGSEFGAPGYIRLNIGTETHIVQQVTDILLSVCSKK